jgi:hypothetical protein
MKSASDTLKAFLFSKQGYVFADLYTITLARGAGVLRWTSADRAINANGYTFAIGPTIKDGGAKQARGLDVDSVDLTLGDEGLTTINGVPLMAFIRGNGLDSAAIQIERAFAADWPTMAASGPVGTFIRFSGRFSQAQDLDRIGVKITATSWLELLSSYVPIDVYQGPCANALFDTRCTVARASYQATGTVGASPTQLSIASNLTSAAGYYDLGTVVFLTGAAAGQTRTIKACDTSGNFSFVAPLPAAPAPGDSFHAYPGCDLQMSTCQTKFANLINFRGEPFIPVPETGF